MLDKKVVNIKRGIIEYKGDFYTAEELAEKLQTSGEFEVVLHEAEDTWFGTALHGLGEEKQ